MIRLIHNIADDLPLLQPCKYQEGGVFLSIIIHSIGFLHLCFHYVPGFCSQVKVLQPHKSRSVIIAVNKCLIVFLSILYLEMIVQLIQGLGISHPAA